VLPTAKAADQSSLDRFYREARAIAALDHPNIVRAYDIDQDENLHFLVMEFVDGTNLQDLVKKFGPLDVLRACHYTYGAAVGLKYAFEMGILHRDIKPANILVDRAGVVKILDMGLARFFHDEDDNLTKKYDENVLGTADYLAPEQAVDSHAVDIRADIYSLGGTFYFMLTGQPPFADGTVAQKLLWHQTRDPKPVRALRPDVPEQVAAVLTKMMAKDPADRYATPADLMAALAPLVQTPIPPPPERELPQFSPAALGVGNGPRMGSAGAAYAASELPTRVGPATATPGTLPAAADVAAPVVPTPKTPETNPAGIWEMLASETHVNAQSDTGSVVRGSSRLSSRRKLSSSTSEKKYGARLLVLAAVVGLLAVGGTAYAIYSLFFSVTSPPAPSPRSGPTVARTWYVAKNLDAPPGEHSMPTLLAAVQKAVPGDTIRILDDQIDDPPIRLDANRFRLWNLTIEAGNTAGRVRWVPSKSSKAAAVLEVIAVEGLRLRGIAIEAERHFDVGVSLAGNVPGLVIEDVTVRNPRQVGFRLMGVAGEPNRPAMLTRVRVSGEAAFDAGLVFAEGTRGDARTATRHVRLTDSRVIGPAQTAVQLIGTATDLEVKQTRIYNVENGIVFSEPSENQPLKVRITSNTFHTIHDAGIRTNDPIPETLPHEVVIKRNYFAQTAILATAPGGQFPGLTVNTNARDDQSREGNVSLSAIAISDVLLDIADPDSEGFLLYPQDSPLNAVGPQKLSVGVSPR
jgi:serine/threonine protein kinase